MTPPRGVGDAAPYNTIRRASHYRKRPRRPGGRPYIPLYHIPWGGPFARDPFTAVCRGRACPAHSLAITTPFILCIVGRGLDPSAGRRGRRPLQHNPQGFSLPQTSAAAWGQAALHPTLPHSVGRAFARNSFTPPRRGRACPARNPAITTPFILCIVGRGLDPSAGRRGRRPLQHNPQGFSLPQTSAAAWGQAALHPTLPHSVGRAFVHDPFTAVCRGRACPARNPAITTPYPLHRRAASHRAFA